MASNLPAPREDAPLAIDTGHEMHANHHDPQHQQVQQNLGVALLPLALIAFMILSFAVAAWTFLAAR